MVPDGPIGGHGGRVVVVVVVVAVGSVAVSGEANAGCPSMEHRLGPGVVVSPGPSIGQGGRGPV